ncbi:MAG: hypothetical protein AB7Q81_22945 [Gammaproteobacteria bacterium]
MTTKRLPAGFEDLEPFLDAWDRPTSHARWIHRNQAPYAEVLRFYEAMLARVEEATALVERHPLDALPDDVARLFRLVLALAHAAIAVELHQASHSPWSPTEHGLRLEAGIQPCG